MAEPADCGLGYLAGFDSLDALWAAHADGRHKFHGILDRIAAAGFSIRAASAPAGLGRDGMDNAAAAFVDAADRRGPGRCRRRWSRPPGASPTPSCSALVDRAGHALRARGVEPEQRVALLMPDGIGFAAAFFGALKLGAVAVPAQHAARRRRTCAPSSRTAAPRCWSPSRMLLEAAGLERAASRAPTR